MTCLALEFKTIERLLKGKKPPEEISVIDKLKESKSLKLKIFKTINMKKVKTV